MKEIVKLIKGKERAARSLLRATNKNYYRGMIKGMQIIRKLIEKSNET